MRLGSRLIQPPGKKGSFRWLIFRCNCIAPWHQLWAAAEHQTGRTHSICTNTSLLQGHFSFLQDWMWKRARGQWGKKKKKYSRTFTGNRFCDDREIPQVICATLWIALFFFLFLSPFCPVVFPYSLCALWRALTIPPSNPIEKAPTKKKKKNRGRWEQQIPFLFPS